ncbi:hypothetical protein BASA62_010421 [Batrachochytrium salamandrivorans]|nr:hypothetical protein BASA62_010421 [Batrachochytrium salamandrivorans]
MIDIVTRLGWLFMAVATTTVMASPSLANLRRRDSVVTDLPGGNSVPTLPPDGSGSDGDSHWGEDMGSGGNLMDMFKEEKPPHTTTTTTTTTAAAAAAAGVIAAATTTRPSLPGSFTPRPLPSKPTVPAATLALIKPTPVRHHPKPSAIPPQPPSSDENRRPDSNRPGPPNPGPGKPSKPDGPDDPNEHDGPDGFPGPPGPPGPGGSGGSGAPPGPGGSGGSGTPPGFPVPGGSGGSGAPPGPPGSGGSGTPPGPPGPGPPGSGGSGAPPGPPGSGGSGAPPGPPGSGGSGAPPGPPGPGGSGGSGTPPGFPVPGGTGGSGAPPGSTGPGGSTGSDGHGGSGGSTGPDGHSGSTGSTGPGGPPPVQSQLPSVDDSSRNQGSGSGSVSPIVRASSENAAIKPGAQLKNLDNGAPRDNGGLGISSTQGTGGGSSSGGRHHRRHHGNGISSNSGSGGGGGGSSSSASQKSSSGSFGSGSLSDSEGGLVIAKKKMNDKAPILEDGANRKPPRSPYYGNETKAGHLKRLSMLDPAPRSGTTPLGQDLDGSAYRFQHDLEHNSAFEPNPQPLINPIGSHTFNYNDHHGRASSHIGQNDTRPYTEDFDMRFSKITDMSSDEPTFEDEATDSIDMFSVRNNDNLHRPNGNKRSTRNSLQRLLTQSVDLSDYAPALRPMKAPDFPPPMMDGHSDRTHYESYTSSQPSHRDSFMTIKSNITSMTTDTIVLAPPATAKRAPNKRPSATLHTTGNGRGRTDDVAAAAYAVAAAATAAASQDSQSDHVYKYDSIIGHECASEYSYME